MNRVEEKYGLKLSHAIALFVIFILNVTWIICDLILYKTNISLNIILEVVLFIATAFYACYAYKKPHGNHMRYLLLCHVLIVAYALVINTQRLSALIISIYLANIILCTYMAGRLEHFKQNVIISVLILLGNCITSYDLIGRLIALDRPITFLRFMSLTANVYLWLAIAGAYITRFKLHKEAGFEDKK